MCPACGSGWSPSALQKGRFRYGICAECGTASLDSGADQADYESGYFSAGTSYGYYDYASDRHLHLETADRRLDQVSRLRPGLGSLVDVGAALGFTLEAARDRGIETVGVEISDHARGQLQQRGFEVHPQLSDLASREFDAVIFGQVLEHMPDPDRALRDAFDLLRPGGVLFIETWDYESKTALRFGRRWQQISPPSVVHLFTSRGLERMTGRLGFSDTMILPWQKRVSVGVYLGVIAAKVPSPIGRAMMSVARATRLTRIALTYSFDDLIAVTARKPA